MELENKLKTFKEEAIYAATGSTSTSLLVSAADTPSEKDSDPDVLSFKSAK